MTAAASRRAIIREADLRRLARVAREEGVALDYRLEPTGSHALTIQPLTNAKRNRGGDDLDDRLAEFARQ